MYYKRMSRLRQYYILSVLWVMFDIQYIDYMLCSYVSAGSLGVGPQDVARRVSGERLVALVAIPGPLVMKPY